MKMTYISMENPEHMKVYQEEERLRREMKEAEMSAKNTDEPELKKIAIKKFKIWEKYCEDNKDILHSHPLE